MLKCGLVHRLLLCVRFMAKRHWNQSHVSKTIKIGSALCVFVPIFLLKTKNSYAFFIFCSVLSASIVAKILKVVIGRARPIFYEALGMTGFYPFHNDWAFNSMPSGHTVASFAGLVMLGMLAPRIKPFTWSLAILIGMSRVAIGAHWPTDVIFGAFIGMVMADLVKWWLKRRCE